MKSKRGRKPKATGEKIVDKKKTKRTKRANIAVPEKVLQLTGNDLVNVPGDQVEKLCHEEAEI